MGIFPCLLMHFLGEGPADSLVNSRAGPQTLSVFSSVPSLAAARRRLTCPLRTLRAAPSAHPRAGEHIQCFLVGQESGFCLRDQSIV